MYIGGHKIGPRFCGKRDKLVYVKTRTNVLDGRQTNHAILEGHFRYKAAYRQPTYGHKGYLDADWCCDVENRRSTAGYVFCCWRGGRIMQ